MLRLCIWGSVGWLRKKSWCTTNRKRLTCGYRFWIWTSDVAENSVLNNEVDTIFFTTSLEYAYLSSSTVKEAAYFGADISKFVPPNVVIEVKNKLMKNKGDR